MKRRSECADSTTSYVKHKKHVAALERKYATYEGKKAILEMWEKAPDEVQIREHDYIVHLRARVRSHRSQLQAMRPGATRTDHDDF